MKPKRRFNGRKIGSLSRKHLRALWDYWTPKKLANLFRCAIEERRGTIETATMPYTAVIELTNACNLRCPGCPTGLGFVGREKSMLTMEHLHRFLDQTDDYLVIANLFNWGEPLLHPRVAEIVRIVHGRRIFTSISSHLSVDDPERLREICDAGLDHLIVSIDGVSKTSYQQYRRGGDLELVLENIRRLVAYKRATKRHKPIIEWQTLGFRHLESEIDKTFELASALGVDWFTVRGAMAPESWQPSQNQLKGGFYGEKTSCGLLWHNVTLQSDGGIAPCCFLYHKKDDFGHIGEGTISSTRNNSRFKAARRMFRPGLKDSIGADPDHPCWRCPVVHKQKHLAGLLSSIPSAVTDEGFMSIVSDQNELEAIQKKF